MRRVKIGHVTTVVGNSHMREDKQTAQQKGKNVKDVENAAGHKTRTPPPQLRKNNHNTAQNTKCIMFRNKLSKSRRERTLQMTQLRMTMCTLYARCKTDQNTNIRR